MILCRLHGSSGWYSLITSDHGNVEQMVHPLDGSPDPEHTRNDVPFIIIPPDEIQPKALRSSGTLADVAPTILELLHIHKPNIMTGHSLIIQEGGSHEDSIHNEVYHPSINGVVISIDTFRKELCALGHEVIIAPDSKQNTDPSHTFRIPSISIPWIKDYGLSRPNASSYDVLRNQNVDIIHTQHMFAMGWFGVRAGRKFSIPSCIHITHLLQNILIIFRYSGHCPQHGGYSSSISSIIVYDMEIRWIRL